MRTTLPAHNLITLISCLDKALVFSHNDKSILVNIVHKFLMAGDLRILQERSTPTKELEMLEEEDINLTEAKADYYKEQQEKEQQDWEAAQESLNS